MRRTKATFLALLFASPAFAQTQVPPPVPPVEKTEAPEDKARDPERQPDTLPVPTVTPAPVAQPAVAAAKPAKPPKWDVNRPTGAPLRAVAINVDEGSWMDVDVSPDGRRIAFTLLGDIYTMRIEGGTETRIAEVLAWEVHPRF